MKNNVLLTLWMIFSTLPVFCQTDHVGSGRAMYFDGIDDYVDLGNIYDDLPMSFTISAWVYLDIGGTSGGPIFVSQDNAPLYNGFWFSINSTTVVFEYGDGISENNPAFRRGKSATVPDMRGKWTHICAVLRGLSAVDLYVNGVNVGGTITGSSSLPMASQFPADVAKIGYFLSNGIIYRFRGSIDQVQVFRRVLTETEIRLHMTKKLKGNEADLIGYWNFDETSGNVLKDSSPNRFDGQLHGNPVRMFSGAPIGDESKFVYTSSWSGATLTHAGLTVERITGNPFGAHIYKVNNPPSQVNGLVGTVPGDYYGVFIASSHTGDRFYVKLNNSLCRLESRKDNSVATWTSTDPAISIQDRAELIFTADPAPFQVDLGADINLCNQASHLLHSPAATVSGRSVLWNTGEITPSITVTQSGDYIAKVSEGCKIDQDTVKVSFQQTPASFSLGPNEVLCSFPRMLQLPPAQDLEYTWQDGTKQGWYEVKNYGKYWVKAANFCGSFADTITFIEDVAPLSVDFGADISLCNQTSYILSAPVTLTSGRSVLWSTGEITPFITVTRSGEYAVKISQACKTDQDTVKVSFLQAPASFSLGADEVLCSLPKTLQLPPARDLQYTWHDGSSQETYEVKDYGRYWVKAENFCGTVTDSITFTKFVMDPENIPNVITPNGDVLNQYFMLSPTLQGATLFVYNRWGKRVYQSLNYKNEWDGGNLESGVYFYVLSNHCVSNFKSTVHILR